MWNYICKKANQVEESLAKLSLSLNHNCIVFNLVPDFLQVRLYFMITCHLILQERKLHCETRI
jgi:hypothetical protein